MYFLFQNCELNSIKTYVYVFVVSVHGAMIRVSRLGHE